jgi:hypothetical protein
MDMMIHRLVKKKSRDCSAAVYIGFLEPHPVTWDLLNLVCIVHNEF